MANDFSVNSSTYVPSIPIVTGSAQVTNSVDHGTTTIIGESLTSGFSSSNDHANSQQPIKGIQTSVELKQAEMRGDKVSAGDEVVIKAIEKANKALDGRYTSFEFSVHEKTKQISIKVLDKDTGEVIREIPPEKTLDMVARLWEMAGILVDEKR
ncbi:flagellar protein FlaG [Paenibacillus sp. GCM10027628]|uniref:flagellar protein FlaG n=1 Tax=Paenibacillus sp. GCM10027628 TaxID=3273413 RepID=UPI003637C9DA